MLKPLQVIKKITQAYKFGNLNALNQDWTSSSHVSSLAYHRVKDGEFESVIVVWASVIAFEITYAQLIV